MKRLNLVVLSLLSLAMFVGCDKLEDVFGEKENNQLQQEFQVIKDGLNGYDELLINNSTTICYKTQESGLPYSLMILIDNEEIRDCYNYIIFDDKGIPSYMNINNQSVYVENVRGNKYDLLIINSDKTFFQIKDAESEVDIENYWSNQSLTRSGYTQSNAQNAVCLLNHLIGGVTMIEGGAAMLVGCAMLVPGANIAVGATIAIAGAATFISGALLTARATDLLVSDGSHTDGFDAASGLLGAVGTAAGQGTVTQKVVDILLNTGYDGLQEVLDNSTDEEEIKEKAKKIIEGRLLTGGVEKIDYDKRCVELSGSISNKINTNDYTGIYISKDPNTNKVDNCFAEANSVGKFYVSFDDLDPATEYYYRAYYYSTEFDEYYVASKKNFVIPGVKTLSYTPINKVQYDVYGKLVGLNDNNIKYGICYSATQSEPTINDNYVYATNLSEQKFSIKLNVEGDLYYYRAFAMCDDDIMYGDVEILTNERLILENFYYQTKGNEWNNSINWCSSKALDDWFGVSLDGQFVSYLDFTSNNLQGRGVLRGLKVLHDIHIENNKLKSIIIQDCPNFQIQHHWMTENDAIILESYKVINCGKHAAYVGFDDIFDSVENGYSSYYTHENWLGNSHIGRCYIDTVYIDKHYHCNQTFFNNLTSKIIEIRNVTDFGRIFFSDVVCDKIIFENCQFNDQGFSIEYDSQVSSCIVDNCYFPSGCLGGYGVTTTLKNSTVSDWWACDGFFSISNTTIEGIYISSFSGSAEAVSEYLRKIQKGR